MCRRSARVQRVAAGPRARVVASVRRVVAREARRECRWRRRWPAGCAEERGARGDVPLVVAALFLPPVCARTRAPAVGRGARLRAPAARAPRAARMAPVGRARCPPRRLVAPVREPRARTPSRLPDRFGMLHSTVRIRIRVNYEEYSTGLA